MRLLKFVWTNTKSIFPVYQSNTLKLFLFSGSYWETFLSAVMFSFGNCTSWASTVAARRRSFLTKENNTDFSGIDKEINFPACWQIFYLGFTSQIVFFRFVLVICWNSTHPAIMFFFLHRNCTSAKSGISKIE